jgi:hypothetical protein
MAFDMPPATKFPTNKGRFFFHGATSPYSFSPKEMWPGFIDDHSSHNSLKAFLVWTNLIIR